MILAVTTLARFSVVVVILVGVLTILGMVWKSVSAVTKAILTQIEATRENTRAIRELGNRVTRLEQSIESS